MQSLKNLFSALFILIILALPGSIFAVSFYGKAETLFDFMFPIETGSDRYDSLLNPHNIAGINDISAAADVTVKLEDEGEKGNFALWVTLDSETDTGSYDKAELDLLRLTYDWRITDTMRITAGRMSFLTGYGYGWNPMDLANPLKDPSNPDQELKGVDAVSFTWDRGGFFQARGYTLLQTSEPGRIAYEEVKAGAELTFLLPLTELKLSALTGAEPDTGRIESLPRSIGMGFLMDIAGAGIYAEGAFRERRRTGVPGDSGDYELRADDDPVFSALAGIEYYFKSELALIAEYFYNGEGFGRGERSDFKEALKYYNSTTTGYAPEEYYELYRPGYFARHYLLLNLTFPLYDLESETGLTVIGSPDSRMISATPRWKILPAGSFEIEISYSGLFSLDDGQYNEAWLSPLKHSASLATTYHF